MRAWHCAAVVLTASCFVDDVAPQSGGGPAATSSGGASTTGGAGGQGAGGQGAGPGPGSGAGGTGGDAIGAAGGVGGMGGAGGAGAGGAGGSGACENHYLAFDESDAFIAYDQSFDYSNDFSFGARIRLRQDAKFDEAGNARSGIFGRAETMTKGYGVGVVEEMDDTEQRFFAVVFINNAPCELVDPVPVPLDEWRDVRVFYKKGGGAAHHLFLTVEGNMPVSRVCANVDTATFGGDLRFGAAAPNDWIGDLDNVFLRSKEDGPPDCADGDFDAIFSFEEDVDFSDGLDDDCDELPLVLMPGASPPVVSCE